MTLSLTSIRRLILLLVLVQSASLYKIYAFDDNRSDLSSKSSSSPLNDYINKALALKNLGYDDEDMDFDKNTDDENKDDMASWLSADSQNRQQRKRSGFPIKLRSLIALPQRRNSRPHWNPLVAAYKRCGELSRREDRESCFKDAIQMLFVHKLRK